MPAAQRDPDNLRAHRSSSILVFSYVTCLRYWLTSDWPASKVEETQLSIAELKGYVRLNKLLMACGSQRRREKSLWNDCKCVSYENPSPNLYLRVFIHHHYWATQFYAGFPFEAMQIVSFVPVFGVVISFPSGFLSLSLSNKLTRISWDSRETK